MRCPVDAMDLNDHPERAPEEYAENTGEDEYRTGDGKFVAQKCPQCYLEHDVERKRTVPDDIHFGRFHHFGSFVPLHGTHTGEDIEAEHKADYRKPRADESTRVTIDDIEYNDPEQ